MREGFHSHLQELRELLADMAAMAATALRQATRAVLDADLRLAEQILDADTRLDAARDECEHHCQSLLALQAPVAGDLRMILAAAYCADRLERMGDLAGHVAGVARQAHPRSAVPVPLRPCVVEMAERATAMADRIGELLRHPWAGAFTELLRADRAVDAAHASVMAEITRPDCPYGVPVAANLALLSRFYERFADQTVSVAVRLEFAVTGVRPSPAC